MWPFCQSLGLDHVDRYNTWVVLFLLVLTLISWLLPLSPVLLPQAQSPASSGTAGTKTTIASSSEPVKAKLIKRYKAQCWCPAEFTSAYVDYTNAVCEESYNFILNGGNFTEAPAVLYTFQQAGGPAPTRFGENMMEKGQKDREIVEKQKGQQQQLRQEEKREREHVDKAMYFFQVTTPFNLFLLAVCLAIPRFVWHTFSCLLGGVNVDQILVSANQGSSLNHESRQQLHSELSKAATDAAKASSWKTSILYLLLKLLMCVAVVSETIVVNNSLLPETRDFTKDLQQNKMPLESSITTHQENSDSRFTIKDVASATQNAQGDGQILFCSYPIRNFLNDQNFEIQCMFSPVPDLSPSTTISISQNSNTDSPTKSSSVPPLYIYECLYLIILTVLVVLVANNGVSFLVWLAKLTSRPCNGGSDLPLDIHFLLQMAKENAGPEFVSVLAQRETAVKQNNQALAEEYIELKT